MGKKVKVVTKCGEEHVYTYNQEVETVEIINLRFRDSELFNDIVKKAREICEGHGCTGCPLGFGYVDSNSDERCLRHHVERLPAYKKTSLFIGKGEENDG